MSFWANFFWANVVWANVFLGKYLSGQMSLWANVVWANVLLGKRRMGKCLWANVVWANVMEPFTLYICVLGVEPCGKPRPKPKLIGFQ
jgi:hypothetical protein